MSSIPVRNRLDCPHLGVDSVVYKLVAAKIPALKPRAHEAIDFAELWSASWWCLEDSHVYSGLNAAMQQAVVAACNRELIKEAYFIEKSGLAFSAKMVLLSETTDVAQLYSLIGADEAKHLAWIEPYV